jgi:catechol 2,3-dioxygenase-like lactoylglutathione lyase family enzyme
MDTTRFGARLVGSIVGLACLAALVSAQQAPGKAASASQSAGVHMRIHITSVMVNDQEKALKFYTEVLGFVKKVDVPAGGARWLTVVSPEQPDGPELLLEPIGFPPAKTYQKALFDAGIPLTAFEVTDIAKTYEKLVSLGVVFRSKPAKMGPVTIAVFEDTCGNLIQLVQQ